jgi:hypothetical protein
MTYVAATKVSCHDARRWAALMFLSRKAAKARRKGKRQFPYLLLCGLAPLCDKKYARRIRGASPFRLNAMKTDCLDTTTKRRFPVLSIGVERSTLRDPVSNCNDYAADGLWTDTGQMHWRRHRVKILPVAGRGTAAQRWWRGLSPRATLQAQGPLRHPPSPRLRRMPPPRSGED